MKNEIVCTCKYITRGQPMLYNNCKVHEDRKYSCDLCKCTNKFCIDYRPQHKPKNNIIWPRCMCGHIAEEHN